MPHDVRVGALRSSDGAAVTQAPTTDRDAVRAALGTLTPDGGTATGDALDAALRALRSDGAGGPPAAIVLLSDGATTGGREPEDVAEEAARLQVPVYTVALGTSGGTVTDPRTGQEIPVPPDPETLAAVAERSGGRAFSAEDADALTAVYRELGSRLGTKPEEREVTAAFTTAGLLLLGAGLARGVRRRAPLT